MMIERFHPEHFLPRLLALTMLLVGMTSAARAQDPADTTWDDLGLDPEGFKLDEDIFGHVSTGWFPQPYVGYTLSLSTAAFYADVYDRANGIRPNGLVRTTEPFGHHDPYESNSDREILQPNSDKEEDDGYPGTDFGEYQLQFLFNLPLPLVLRGTAGLQITEGLLFAGDTSRSYLSIGGVPQPFQEVSTAYLKQYMVGGSAGVIIPFYGGFIKNEGTVLSSYYYVFGGMSAWYAVSSKATQYTQIANAKDQIRYGNGTDTVTLINKRTLSDLERWRTAYEVGIGWNLAVESFALGFEAFASVPQTSVLKDVDWKQYYVGFRLSLGGHWWPEKAGGP